MKSNTKISKFLMGTASVAALNFGITTSVIAQDDDDAILEEIVVTATKRSANLQDVPMAITALTSNALKDALSTDIRDLDKNVAGLSFRMNGNNVTPIIRGAGVAGTSDVAVPVYVDGAYKSNTIMALAGFLDVERVETLRGPQGTLFGRNAMGGLIHVVTKKPSTEAFDYGAAVTVGNYGAKKFEGFVNVPLGDKLAVRLTARDAKRDPFQENVYNPGTGYKDENNTYARLQVQYDVSEDISLRAGYTYWRDTANGNGSYGAKPIGVPMNTNGIIRDGLLQTDGMNGYMDPRYSARDGFSGGRDVSGHFENGQGLVLDDPMQVAFNFMPFRDIDEDTFFVALDWAFEGHELKVNAERTEFTEVRISDADFSPQASWVEGQDNSVKSTQVDVYLNSTHDGDLQYTVGGYYYNSHNPDTGYAWLFGYDGGSGSPADVYWSPWSWVGGRSDFGAKSLALYGNAVYSLSDKLSVEVGLRYTDDERSNGRQSTVYGTHNDGTVPEYDPATSYTTESGDNVDYKLGVVYNVNDDLMVYANTASGYILGGLSGGTDSKLLPNQTAESYEAGFKSTWLDGRMQINASAFMVSYDNLLTTVYDTGPNDIAIARSIVGGSIKSKGIEAELKYSPTDNFHIEANTSIDFSEFDEFGAPNNFDLGPALFVQDGKDLPFTPAFTMGLTMYYDVDLGDSGTLTPRFQSYTSSSYKAHTVDYFFSRQPGYTKIDLSLTWISADEKVNVKAFVKNVTNEINVNSLSTFSRSRVMADYSDPRTVGIRIGYNF